MAERKKHEVSKIDALYSWIAYDLQRMKSELLTELKYSSTQTSSLYETMKAEQGKSTQAMTQEIRYSYKQNQTIYDGVAQMITQNVGDRLGEMNEKLAGMQQSQNELLSDDVMPKINSVEEKLAMLDQIEFALEEIGAKLATLENVDYNEISESVSEKTEETVAEYTRRVMEAVAAIPVAENVDYTRIVDEVGDKLLEILGELKSAEAAPVEATVDYDKIIYGTTEKIIESLPVVEKINYSRIDEGFAKAAESVKACVNEEALASVINTAVANAIAALDINALAAAVAEKIALPEVKAPEIDYDCLAEKVAQKLAATNEQTYDVVLDENGLAQIAEKVAIKLSENEKEPVVPEAIDYDRIAGIVEEKLACDTCEESTYDLVIDNEGISAIAKGVAEELCGNCCVTEAPAEETVEEVVEEVVDVVEEAPVEEVVEEAAEEAPVEEVVEEAVEETPVEEVVEEAPAEEIVEEVVEEAPAQETAEEEIAVAVSPSYEEINDQLVDAETGLVIRLKKSFTAKIRQSEENVKQYYSNLKNELTSYKKINSNVSWHGDRFNFGRDTVAKINICGKTLCFYLALDPNDPEYKQTVYHQKDVGAQKAYENTPFMVKVKSDGAAKKALRLVGLLAEKLGTQKEENFEEVDYVGQFEYQSTKELFETGYIKATKEKKVDLDTISKEKN